MKKFKNLTLIFIIFGLLLIAAAVLLQLFTPLGKMRRGAFVQEKYFENVRDVTVISASLPINLCYTDEEACRVAGYSRLPLMISCDEAGALRITQDDSFTLSLFDFDSDKYHITVMLPRKSYGRISLSASGGKITAEAVSCESLEISTKNGDISVNGGDERTKIKTVGGNIDLSLTSLNGDMTIIGGEGDVSLTIPESIPYFAEFLTESGSCNLNGGKKGDAVFLNKGGGQTVRVTTTEGSLFVSGG